MCHARYPFEVGDVELGIPYGLGVDCLRFRRYCLLQRFKIVRFNKLYNHTEARKSVMEKVISTSVEVIHGYDLIPRLGDVEERHCRRGLSARNRERTYPAVHGCNP